MNQTLAYYNKNAAAFCEGTVGADMSHLYEVFLRHIPEGGRILDLGCGSGRDSLEFLRKGYSVEAIDGSSELARLASEYIGQTVRCMDFEELDYEAEFDGVWACASLLHAPKSLLPSILVKIHRALVPGGILYFSFKRGDSERMAGERFFNDYTEDTVKDLFIAENGWELKELFVTGDVREGRGEEQWVNGVVKRIGRVNPGIIGFYHEYDAYGCFSNWYRAEFEYAGKRFSSVEQYMMYHKVIMFRQYELAMKILASDDPAVVKKLGRTRFAQFDAYVWDRTSYAIVKRGVKAKFLQNPKLLRLLLDTGDCVLAECSQNDRKWGIGVDIGHPDCMDPSKWTGKNYLGRMLMEVRRELHTAALYGSCEYKDAREVDFSLWHEKAGVLLQNPKYHQSIKAYADTLHGDYERKCFYYDGPLSGWEEAMNTNMGGGLPAVGFWELKQDLYDIWRMTPGG